MSSDVRRTLPNVITLFRLVAATAFFVIVAGLMREPTNPGWTTWGNTAMGVFIVAALSDILDGHLARRWKAVSTFGRIMDPFGDKVLVLGAFVLLASPIFHGLDPLRGTNAMLSGITGWMVVVILARELLVTSLRGVLESMGVDFSADMAGKWKMLVQSICIPVCLFVASNDFALRSAPWRMLRDGFAWATVIVTVWSVVPYVLRARRLLKG